MTMIMVTRLLENPAAQRLARVHLHFLWQGLVVGDRRLVAARGLAAGLGQHALRVAGDPAGCRWRPAPWRPSRSSRPVSIGRAEATVVRASDQIYRRPCRWSRLRPTTKRREIDRD